MKHLDKYALYAMSHKHHKEAEKFINPSGEEWEINCWELILEDELVSYDQFVDHLSLDDEE